MSAENWYLCPSCKLKHSERPDMKCPRCHEPLRHDNRLIHQGEPRPASDTIPPKSTDSPSSNSNLGWKIAGIILIINGLMTLAEQIFMESTGIGGRMVFSSVVVDLILGGMLIAENKNARVWVIVRVLLGLVIFTGIYLSAGDKIAAVAQMIFSVVLLALLIGQPKKTRIAISCTLFGLLLALNILGYTVILTGKNPIGKLILSLDGTIESSPISSISGKQFPYELDFPSNGQWYPISQTVIAKQNSEADKWFVRADSDAHVLIICEPIQEHPDVNMENYVQAVLTNAKSVSTDLKVISDFELDEYGDSRLIQATGKSEGVSMTYYWGLFMEDAVLYQVYAFAFVKTADLLHNEIIGIIGSFRTANAVAYRP